MVAATRQMALLATLRCRTSCPRLKTQRSQSELRSRDAVGWTPTRGQRGPRDRFTASRTSILGSKYVLQNYEACIGRAEAS